ncbi:MAG TPA: ABC transporter ATP-binding protein [Stellaceae bacterium]|nr:ABC transporter ATP-binding protein [Stellaceae bacterium]
MKTYPAQPNLSPDDASGRSGVRPSVPRKTNDADPSLAVELRGLRKVYRGSGRMPEKTALDDVDLEIPRGSIFGLLGPNGAGKSTLINILAGLVIKTAGTARVWGVDIDEAPRQARAAIGVVPQELNVDAFFTPREMMELQAGLYGVPRAERLTEQILAILGLADKADAYARTLSGGMRRRLMVAKAMVHSPPVLVLDEPTAGVDVELRQQLWAQVRALNAAGTTVLLTTHYLDEAEALCDRIAIINHGRVVACDTTAALLSKVEDKTLILTLAAPVTAIPPSLAHYGLTMAKPDRLVLRYNPARTPVAPLFAALQQAGLTVRDVSTEEVDLEDIFLRLTGSATKEG